MRLAQIARKVDSKPQDIRKFIQEKFNVELDADPNTKVDEEQVNAILEHFKKEEVVEETVIEEVKEEVEVVDDTIDPTIETDIESLKELAEEEAGDLKIEIPEVAAEEAKPVPDEFVEEENEMKEEKKKAGG